MEVPEIEYTRSGDVAIAYQAFGDGPRDLVFVPMFSNLVFPWSNPDWRAMYDRFASFSRLIMFDKRGTGLSDRPRELGPLETRMDDIRAVLDAAGADRATLVGMGEGGHTCALFAATYPERTEALALFNTPARVVSAQDYPYGIPEDEWRTQLRTIRERWGAREYFEAQAREINPAADDSRADARPLPPRGTRPDARSRAADQGRARSRDRGRRLRRFRSHNARGRGLRLGP